ncbi:MAG: hypothetical protein Q4F65_09105 [Propionibacteriaceae bacterium]|nr:hypothetical protein [Propionibacteriaceae bacterium]
MDTPDIRSLQAFWDEGWTPKELRAAIAEGSLERIRRGRLAPGATRTPTEQHVLAAVAAWQSRSPDHAISHTSAAVLHGLPVRSSSLTTVELTRWSNTHGKTSSGVRLHRAKLPDDEVVILHGVRVTSLERTVADLARQESYGWGVVAADAALRLDADRALLTDHVDRGTRKRNNARLRQVLAFASPDAESAAESWSRVSIARAGLPMPELQFQVHIPEGGGWAATCDFGWPEHGIVGEVDGKLKYTDDERRGRQAADVVMQEKDRDAAIIACGYTPVHWDWKMALNHTRLGAHLRDVFAGRGVQL